MQKIALVKIKQIIQYGRGGHVYISLEWTGGQYPYGWSTRASDLTRDGVVHKLINSTLVFG